MPVKAGSSDPSGSTKVVPIPTVNAERLSKQIRMLYKDLASIGVTYLRPTDLEDYRWAMDEIRNLRAVLESPATESFLSDKNALKPKCEWLKPQLPVFDARARDDSFR